eukprot:2433773-Rhodomonas_salina.2
MVVLRSKIGGVHQYCIPQSASGTRERFVPLPARIQWKGQNPQPVQNAYLAVPHHPLTSAEQHFLIESSERFAEQGLARILC